MTSLLASCERALVDGVEGPVPLDEVLRLAEFLRVPAHGEVPKYEHEYHTNVRQGVLDGDLMIRWNPITGDWQIKEKGYNDGDD